MKLNKKEVLAFLSAYKDYILLVLALIVVAWGIIGAVIRQPGKARNVPALVFTHWWDKELDGGIPESLIREFEETHGNVRIVMRPLSYDETRQLLLDSDYNAYEEGISEFPGDILAIDRIWIQELYKNGVLDPAYTPEPLISFFYPLFYNIDLLKNAGFNRPPKNRSELLSMSDAVRKTGTGRYGIAFALGTHDPSGVYRDIYPWFWASGISMLDGGRPFRETFDFFSRLHQENLMHPDSFFMGEEEKREAFINSKIAFMTGRVQDIELFREKMGEEAFGIGLVPGADSYLGKPVFGVSDWELGVFTGSKYKEEAAEFIRFLSEKSSVFAEKMHIIPDNGENVSPELMRDPFYSKALELYIGSDLMREFSEENAVTDEVLNTTYRDIIFREELFAFFEGKHDSASATTAILNRWQP